MLRALWAALALSSIVVVAMIAPGLAAAETATGGTTAAPQATKTVYVTKTKYVKHDSTKYVNNIPVGWLLLVAAVLAGVFTLRKELLKIYRQATRRRRARRRVRRQDFSRYLHLMMFAMFVMAVVAMLTIYHHSFDVTLWLR
jgi:uncharacterized BrkB/YihY/UPF0761 family membrane protein